MEAEDTCLISALEQWGGGGGGGGGLFFFVPSKCPPSNCSDLQSEMKRRYRNHTLHNYSRVATFKYFRRTWATVVGT